MSNQIKKPKISSLINLPIMLSAITSTTSTNFRSNVLLNIKSSTITSVLSASNTDFLIGTHDGSFHCDEALAIGMLKILPRFATCPVLRSRKPDLLNNCGIIVDVGAIYEPKNHRYDHHQREFIGTLDNFNTRLSSAGLVYKHFGKEILTYMIESYDSNAVKENTLKLVDIVYPKLYKGFMEHIDAIDNGISICEEPKYHISTSLSSRVGMLNPNWNEEATTEVFNSRFNDAIMLTCSEFLAHADNLLNVWWPARSLVQKAVENRFDIHSSGKIIILDHCPWKDHIFELEKELSIDTPIIYALYEDLGGSWRIQVINTSYKKLILPV